MNTKFLKKEEAELMKKTLEESRRVDKLIFYIKFCYFNNFSFLKDLRNTNQYNPNSSINKVVNEGFPLEMVLQAFAIVGDDPELMILFLTENLSYP